MKYQLTPKIAQFDKDGFVSSEGWALIYNTNVQTGEFITATYEYVAVGIGLPTHVCVDKPTQPENGRAIVLKNGGWIYPHDHRGQKVYSITNGSEKTITEIGDIPDGYTTMKPASEFDRWDGGKWVLDAKKQHQHDIDVATAKKQQLLNATNAQIEYLQDAIDADIATDKEKTLFSEWKKYRVLLNRIDLNQAPDIEWPNKPSL